MRFWAILDRVTGFVLLLLLGAMVLMLWHLIAADTSSDPDLRLRIIEPPRKRPYATPVAPRERRAERWMPSLRYHPESPSPRCHGTRHRDGNGALAAASPLPRHAGIAELAALKEARP